MRKLKIFISVCLLSSTLPTSVLASYKLDQGTNGVDIEDVVKAIQDPQAMRTITGKNIFDQADVRNLLSQIGPKNQKAILGTITGFVTDETGAAVSGAKITIDGTNLEMLTNASGHFQFNDVPTTYQTKVHVSKDDYDPIASEVFNIQSGDIRNFPNLILRKIPIYGSVSGYVYGPDNLALESALVTVDNSLSPLTVYSDTSGYYFFNHVPTGNHSLTVTKDTYTPFLQAFSVTKDNLTTIPTLHLAKTGSSQLTGNISGNIASTTGSSLQSVQIHVKGTEITEYTDASGNFTINNLPVGSYTLQISAENYVGQDISVTVLQAGNQPVSVSLTHQTAPNPGVPVTSIDLSLYTNSDRISSNGSTGVRLIIAPYTATNKDIVWSTEPSAITTVSQQGYLNVTGIGHFTLTATNPLSGISQTLELEAVDSESALRKVQTYAEGTTSLTLEDLKNTCVGNIVDSAFENYKRAIVAKRSEFVGLQNYQISNLLQNIISEYTSTAALNQALYDYSSNEHTAWDALNKDDLLTFGVYHTDATNVQYVKQVILDTFMESGRPFSRTQLNTLVSKVPSFSVRSYNPTVYATQMISQHLNSTGSNVVMTFKVANLYNEGNTGLTSQDVKAIVSGESRGLYDSAMFSNFLNLGDGVYSFEVLESALVSPLKIVALAVRVGETDIPIATDISVNRQAAQIENLVANHTPYLQNEQLFAQLISDGHLLGTDEINFEDLINNLELAYVAHGNVLTEGSIRRIINGMGVVMSYHQTQSASTDTYSLTFDQNITGNLFYSVTARNQNGYLTRHSTGYSTNIYDFTFGHTSTFPIVITYMADSTEKLRYSSDNSVVPDFEIIFTNSSF